MNSKVVKNAAWIIGAQIIKALLGIVISMLTARYLGPANYGLINYAASIVAFVAPIMYLGLNGVLVQEIINNPNEEGKTLGTAMCMSLISSVFCIVGVASFVRIANPGERETLIVCVLYSILLVFQSLDLILYWFQAKLLSKYSSVVSLCAYTIISIYKIVLLALGRSIYWFAVSNALDYMLISVSLIVIYCRLGAQKLCVSFQTAKRLLNNSKYYIVSNMMIVIFAQIDRIMLKIMVSDLSTGIYSAAVSCAGLASFVFTAVIDSMRPSIFQSKQIGDVVYENSIIKLYNIVIYLSLLYSTAVSFLAPIIIRVLYGEKYILSVSVLQIIVWHCTFSYLGGARDIWILAEGKQKYLIILNFVGATSNVILNYFLIRVWAANGAAIASLITQIVVNIIFVSVYKPTRRNGYLILKACNPKILVISVAQIMKKRG